MGEERGNPGLQGGWNGEIRRERNPGVDKGLQVRAEEEEPLRPFRKACIDNGVVCYIFDFTVSQKSIYFSSCVESSYSIFASS